jgi:hypothetical protein
MHKTATKKASTVFVAVCFANNVLLPIEIFSFEINDKKIKSKVQLPLTVLYNLEIGDLPRLLP